MTDDILHITSDPREKIKVDLVGVRYDVWPPKTALAIRLAKRALALQGDVEQASELFDVLDTWIDMAFGKPIAKKVRARMEDGEDDLDFPHIMKLMEALIERSTGNPTSSS